MSVCMATYNGSEFVHAQLTSILAQIGADDEVIVVDDGSTDSTPDAVRDVADDRIKLVTRRDNRGYVATFEEALALSTGEHVFLADQDDIWPAGRVRLMQLALADVKVVAGNLVALDPATPVRPVGAVGSWRLTARSALRPRRMTLRLALSNAPYYGSAMAVRRDLLEEALPFPPSVQELHDAWFALLGLAGRSIAHVEADVVLRRLHRSNASGRPRSLPRILKGRALFLRMWIDARRRTTRPR